MKKRKVFANTNKKNIWIFIKNKKSFYSTLFSIFSFIFVISYGIFNENITYISLIIVFVSLFIISIIIHFVYLYYCKKLIYNYKFKNNCRLKIIYGDILKLNKEKNYIIIPIDEDMNYKVNDTIVSKNTLHGKYLINLKKSGVEPKTYFENLGKKTINNNEYNNKNESLVDEEKKTIFLPLTKFDENNQAYTNTEKYFSNLINLLKTIDDKIPSNSDYIFNLPIIGGSDKSRNLDIKQKEFIEIIKILVSIYPFKTENIKISIIIYS